MLDDVQFVANLAPELGDEYRNTKRYVHDVPTQALLHVRSFTHRLTALLAAPHQLQFDSPNLYDRIEQLNRQRLIDVRLTRALHRLRADGNRGAHPEKYHLSNEALAKLAHKSLSGLLSVVAMAYPRLIGSEAPEYQLAEARELDSRELSYRAVMQDDHHAQYLLGVAFKNRALIQKTEGEGELDDANRLLAKAAYWFEQASETEASAKFEYGVALLHGYRDAPQPERGEQLIAAAAEQQVTDAMALLGYFYLVGSHCFPVDLAKAEHYLHAAAVQDQTEAMANLGVLFYQQQQLTQAFQWIKQAAQSGYPHAQYHLSLMLARGEGCELDIVASEQWLAEAAEQGQLDAMLARAQHMLNEEQSFGSDLSQAEHYLREVIRYEQRSAAMIELAIALTDGSFGRIDVVEAAAWLKMAKGRANSNELAVVTPLIASLKQQTQNVLAVSDNAAERKSLSRALELLSEAEAQ
ncbi:SEL1-like repeat protein [Shewanella avicenniae]|uniref:SEL1-like repeat protein n=1 Tax=Shewanella avicenniae TaxID=2814294 RepID=A0ABX7QR44_9GAMM|nr:tetratricopeptide repeat protein [Shewanella avicenniae]QSX33879.1 SEL1-like repeat protein [Shewanella avicenniae]